MNDSSCAVRYFIEAAVIPNASIGKKRSGFTVDHTAGIYPVSAAGIPFSVSALASKGDIITDLHEDLAADGASL